MHLIADRRQVQCRKRWTGTLALPTDNCCIIYAPPIQLSEDHNRRFRSLFVSGWRGRTALQKVCTKTHIVDREEAGAHGI